MYVYINREREREREIYIYIYIYSTVRRGKGFENEKPRLGSPIDNTDCSIYFGIDKSFRFVEGTTRQIIGNQVSLSLQRPTFL